MEFKLRTQTPNCELLTPNSTRFVMFEELERSIESKNYDIALKIIEQLQEQGVDELWLRYYNTLMIEKQERFIEAEKNYRQIIKDSIYPDPKLIGLIRNAIERINIYKQEIKTQEQQVKANKKAIFSNIENSHDLAILVLTEVSLAQKQQLAPELAQIMEIDRYTAMLQIPTRSWKLYKTGQLGELNFYQTELAGVGIPCFCYPINQVNSMTVYNVDYVTHKQKSLVFNCQDELQQKHTLSVSTNEITSIAKGMMPLFELTVNIEKEIGGDNVMVKRESTLDYVAFLDLHCPIQNKIFRFDDRSYQFDFDKSLSGTTTTQAKWKELENNLNNHTNSPTIYNTFKVFAENVLQFPEMLQQIKSHVRLYRRDDSLWDQAWQLYSSLIFLENQKIVRSSSPQLNQSLDTIEELTD